MVDEREKRMILAGTSLQNDSSSQFSVGLNMFEELSYKYNRELKNQLKSKYLKA